MTDSHDNPDRRRRWLVLLGLALTYACTNGILVHTLPIIYPRLIDEFGWTATQVTLPATVFYVVGALTSPPSGLLLDRFSSRLVIAIGLIGVTIGLVGYSLVAGLGQLVAVYVLFAASLSMCGLVSNMLIVSRWFDDLRGRATGLLLMASSAGGVVFPWVVGSSMAAFGWRGALTVLAVIVVLFALVPITTLVRSRPKKAVALNMTVDRPTGPGPTVREALSSPGFYLLAIATAAVWFTIIAMTQHQSIFLAKDTGIAQERLPAVFSTFFAASVIGKLLFGWLSDHFDKKLMMQASLIVLVAGLVLLRNVTPTSVVTLYGYAVVAGIGFSGAFTMIQLVFANYFAGRSFGTILAILIMIDTLAGALGTRVIARLRETSGDYFGGIDLMIGLLIFAAVCLALPDRRAGRPGPAASGDASS